MKRSEIAGATVSAQLPDVEVPPYRQRAITSGSTGGSHESLGDYRTAIRHPTVRAIGIKSQRPLWHCSQPTTASPDFGRAVHTPKTVR
ncbi:MAG: hypothetical protein M5U23_04280 [Acidimicrobiia bacterium]|nr:hypothetical protein [Acidimicrobiia bacterium]